MIFAALLSYIIFNLKFLNIFCVSDISYDFSWLLWEKNPDRNCHFVKILEAIKYDCQGMNVENKMSGIFRALGDYYRGHKAQTH